MRGSFTEHKAGSTMTEKRTKREPRMEFPAHLALKAAVLLLYH